MRISYYLPGRNLDNEELERVYNDPKWTASKILRKTGIRTRRVVSGELASDLAVKASERLFRDYSVAPSSIDFLLLCTESPDHFLPPTACMVQHRLGIPRSAGALDFNLGCSGYVYGLATAKGYIAAGIARRVLLVTSETYSRHIHPMDRSTRTIFGDGAAATLVDGETAAGMGKFVLGTDGSGAPNLMVEAGAMAVPTSRETLAEREDEGGSIRSRNNLYMNGPEIFAFTLRVVPGLVRETLEANGLALDDVDIFVFHQANRFMLEALRDKLEIPPGKFLIDVEETGNTVSATIPIALRRAMDGGIIRAGNRILIAGFGVGYSWGASVITVQPGHLPEKCAQEDSK